MEVTFTSAFVFVYDEQGRKIRLDHDEALRLAEEIMGFVG